MGGECGWEDKREIRKGREKGRGHSASGLPLDQHRLQPRWARLMNDLSFFMAAFPSEHLRVQCQPDGRVKAWFDGFDAVSAVWIGASMQFSVTDRER
jgi:hypothetical protein